ncbi:MAG: hypothetical protein PHN77_01770 [Thermoguttaceae bacterium]|jgi:hypothetical protein|nr:hypothetical protein [Thermoguttaceae bacterium]
MTWTVAMVAGILLGQVPTSAPGHPAAELGGYWGGIAPAAQAAAETASQGDQVPAPVSGGGFPLNAAAGASTQAPAAEDGAQPAIPAAGQNPPQSAAAADPMSNLGNPLQRIMSITDPKNLGRAGAQGAAGAGAAAPPGAESEGWAPSGTIPAQGGQRQGPPPAKAAGAAAPAARQTAGEFLQAVLALPAGSGVKGRGVSLLDVLGSVSERAKRQDVAHAYWRLAEAVGEYRICWDQAEQFQAIRVGIVDSSLLQAAQQTSRTALAGAELALVQAQHRLAEAAGLDTNAELPLPSDHPHIGTYTTNFERIFVDQSPPTGTRLIHRTLPLQFQAIGVRLEAIHAAQEALQTINKAYLAGQVDVGQPFAAIRGLTDQKRAWLASVCQYNHAIADYALAVVGSETVGHELVSVLIKLSSAEPKRTERGESATADGVVYPKSSTGVEQADYETPAPPAPAASAEEEPKRPTFAPAASAEEEPKRPTFAPAASAEEEPKRPTLAPAASAEEKPKRPTLAPAREELTEAPPSPWAPAPKNLGGSQSPAEYELPAEEPPAAVPPVAPARPEEPAGMPPIRMPRPDRSSSIQQRPLVAVEAADFPSGRRTVYMPPTPLAGAAGRQYASLDGLDEAVQAKRLALQLHAVGEDGPEGKPVGLEASLKGLSARQRQPVLEAYWLAAMRLAEHRVYRRHIQLLDDLVQAVTLGDAGTPEAIAMLKAARLAADADLLEAEVRLTAAQFELTQRSARPLEGPWLLPTTPPHAGPYQMRLELQDRRLAEAWAIRRLAATIPALSEDLARRARSIVECDRRRAETTAAYRNRELPFVRVLDAVEQQSGETREFLGALLAYNQSIAEYAIAIVPPAIPEEKLVATLVLVR